MPEHKEIAKRNRYAPRDTHNRVGNLHEAFRIVSAYHGTDAMAPLMKRFRQVVNVRCRTTHRWRKDVGNQRHPHVRDASTETLASQPGPKARIA